MRNYLGQKKSLTVNAIQAIGGTMLSDMVGSPGFLLKGVTQSVREGDPLIRVDFEFAETGSKDAPRNMKMHGFMVVDPSRSMALREYDLQSESMSKPGLAVHATGRNYYSREKGLPKPTKVISELTYSTKNVIRNVFEVERWDYERTPAQDFSLAAYGLGDTRRPSTRWSYGIAF